MAKNNKKQERIISMVGIILMGFCLSAMAQENVKRIVEKPDTPNLEERAEMAINCLTRSVDPKLDYQPWFFSRLINNPPGFWHCISDYGDMCGRSVDALTLARNMTGSKTNAEVDEKLKSLLISFIKENGLMYYPERAELKPGETHINEHSYALLGLVTWYLSSHDKNAKTYIDRMIKKLLDIAIKKNDYYYFPVHHPYFATTGWAGTDEPPLTGWPAPAIVHGGFFLRQLVRYAEETGSKDAEELAKNIVNWIVFHSGDYFGKDGSFKGLFVGGTTITHGVLRYGQYAKRDDFVQWTKKVFDYMTTQSGSFGWFPEFISDADEGGETCPLTDMIEIAIRLAEVGYEEYWNIAEIYGRNHLLESQLIDLEPIKRVPPEKIPNIGVEQSSTGPDTLEKAKGSFASWSAVNDFFGTNSVKADYMGGAGCCNASGVRGLYALWHHIVTKKEDGVFVNLLFSRDTPWVEVNSYLPYEGKLEVMVHDAPVVHVRIPDWVEKTKIKISVNGENMENSWVRKYVKITGLKPDDHVHVTFPIRHKHEKEVIKNKEYTVEWKGDTVISIEPRFTTPPSGFYPLYMRESLKRDGAPLKKGIVYHVPKKEIDW